MDQAQARDVAIEALKNLIEERGWQGFGMADLAERAGLDLATLYRAVGSRHGALLAVIERVDKLVLAAGPADAADPPRDRLFEVMMRRYDALVPWRAALARLARELPLDPLAALAVALATERSLARMLEAARIGSGGIAGPLRVRGLVLVHMAALRVLVDDDTPDLAATMRALDGRLKAVERWASLLDRALPQRRSGGPDPGPGKAAPKLVGGAPASTEAN